MTGATEQSSATPALVRMARLIRRLVLCTDQRECDSMEAELVALEAEQRAASTSTIAPKTQHQ